MVILAATKRRFVIRCRMANFLVCDTILGAYALHTNNSYLAGAFLDAGRTGRKEGDRPKGGEAHPLYLLAAHTSPVPLSARVTSKAVITSVHPLGFRVLLPGNGHPVVLDFFFFHNCFPIVKVGSFVKVTTQ